MKTQPSFQSILLLPLFFLFTFTSAQPIPDFLVNEQGSIDGSQQATPAIGGDGNDNYVVCWQDKRNGNDFDKKIEIRNLGSNIFSLALYK